MLNAKAFFSKLKNNLSKIVLGLCLFGVPLGFSFLKMGKDQNSDAQKLYIYCWVDYIPRDVIENFENETGIEVIYDVYDSNDILEAKLFTGSCAYDLVCPTAWPYVSKQIQSNLYQPLQKNLLPNFKELDPFLMNKLEEIDPENKFIVPYSWGVTGFGYNKTLLDKIYPDAPIDSWAMMFDVNVVKKISEYGLAFLDESVDVIPLALQYLGLNPNSQSLDDLQKAYDLLKTLRPYVKRFGGYQATNDLIAGEMILIQGWSTEIAKARSSLKEINSENEIVFTLPKEGTNLWLDVFAIPKMSHHPENAHKFINYLFTPRVAAQCMDSIESATAVLSAIPLIKEEVRNDPAVFPKEEMKKKLFVSENFPPEIMRAWSRAFFSIKSGQPLE